MKFYALQAVSWNTYEGENGEPQGWDPCEFTIYPQIREGKLSEMGTHKRRRDLDPVVRDVTGRVYETDDGFIVAV